MKISNIFRLSLAALFMAVMLGGCGKNPFRPDYSLVPAPFDTTGTPRTQLSDGLVYYTIDPGYGPFKVVPNDATTGVQIQYTLRNKDGKILSSSFEKSSYGLPFVYNLSVNLSNTTSLVYTQGFREGVLGMRLGEKKVLIVPPDLGYAGSTASIANDTLYYDVQLVSF